MRKVVWVLLMCACWPVGDIVLAQCVVNSGTPTYPDGTYLSAPLCDANGAAKTSGGGGGTQYAEDTAHSSGDSVTMAGVVQQSADAALSGDGDRSVLQVDSNGYLKVNIKAGAGSGGTAIADDAAFTPGSTNVTPAGAVFNDTTPDPVDEGDAGALRMSANRNLYSTIRDAAGNERGANVNASNELLTSSNTELPAAAALADNTANPTVPGVAAFLMCYDGATWDRCQGGLTDTDDGTIATSQVPGLMIPLNYVYDGTNWVRRTIALEDAAETAGGQLTMAGSVRRDTAATSAGTAGDNATVNTDGLGRLWVREGSPCADHARLVSAIISESTAATNEIVALNGSDLIYVCNYKIVTTAATSLTWKYGTGTDCNTGTTAIEGAQPYAANGGVVESGGGYPLFIVPAGNALCLTSSAATAHGGRVTYVRTAAP